MDSWQFLANLHPKLVHFPLALLLAGLIFDAIGWMRRSPRWHWGGRILSAGGTVLLLLTFVCGIYAEVWAGRAGVPQDPIEVHELFANIASWGFVLLMAWRLLMRNSNRKAMLAYILIGLGWYGLLALTAHLGGALVFDYGAAVGGTATLPNPSLHDLNTLAQRQTDLNLRYSEMMHHIFGYLTLALGASLLAQALFPAHERRLRWIGPLLLLLGGIFLLFCADLDLYRLTDLRQFRDREVELHKTLAIVLMCVGGIGLRKSLRREAPPAQRSPQSPEPTASSFSQGQVVAIMALIGGGMLFTHVHTVAPYANVAAGVYIAHIVLGSVALAIGATRLMADALSNWRRTLSTLFSVLLCVEAVLLVTYNEGLPWYIGYGRYNRWGAHGGTIAPFGSFRAELTFDSVKKRIDVYTLDRFNERPRPVPATTVNLLIDRGYQQTSMPLRAVVDSADPSGGFSHFAAHAPFLKDASMFCARLPLPTGSGGSLTTGFFDPWVTPIITAVPPNILAKYQCPMHEGIRSTKPGICPLCGMPMIPITNVLRTTLHDAGYDMQLQVTCGQDAQSTSRTLRFTPLRQGQLLRDLALVHEKLLHLIVVSTDLSFFDHIHPLLQPDGSLVIDYKFPGPGQYLLYADITPGGTRNQVFRFPVNIGTAAIGDDPLAELALSPALCIPLEQDSSITAQLIPSPRTLTAGTHVELLLRLVRDGRPVTDLQPYLGAMGHCVILSQDTQCYLHCHPEQLLTPAPENRGGPDVIFHTVFPRPGRYKLWAQFNHGGTILIAPFVLDIRRSLLPPRLWDMLLNE